MKFRTALLASAGLLACGFLLAVPVVAQAGSPDHEVRFATQTQVVASTSAEPVRPKISAPQPVSAFAAGARSPLNDMALIAPGKVVLNSLGIIVRNRDNKLVSVAIHDAQGRRVYAKMYGSAQQVINVTTNQLKTGAYVYSVMIGDSLFSRSFIVTR